jgi:hypothetical protein
LLLKEKANYYGTNNSGESLVEIEEKKANELKKLKFDPKRLYYSLDGHNIFKRSSRYYYKGFLSLTFLFMTLFNLFEIFFNILLLSVFRRSSNSYTETERTITLLLNMLYICLIHAWVTLTVIKLKIQTYIYY